MEEGENLYCKFIDTNLYLYSYWWLLIIIQVHYFKKSFFVLKSFSTFIIAACCSYFPNRILVCMY